MSATIDYLDVSLSQISQTTTLALPPKNKTKQKQKTTTNNDNNDNKPTKNCALKVC